MNIKLNFKTYKSSFINDKEIKIDEILNDDDVDFFRRWMIMGFDDGYNEIYYGKTYKACINFYSDDEKGVLYNCYPKLNSITKCVIIHFDHKELQN